LIKLNPGNEVGKEEFKSKKCENRYESADGAKCQILKSRRLINEFNHKGLIRQPKEIKDSKQVIYNFNKV
jgi:hypothetical protein